MTVDKIYLVGFMAAGKTTVAHSLGTRLGWRAEDIDGLIEARERMTVADIFTRHGEAYFRAAEREILRLLLPLRHAVVATGGGTFMDPDNRHAINVDGVSVWLDVPLATLLRDSAPTVAVRSPRTARRWSACTRCDRRPMLRRICASTLARRPPKKSRSESSSIWDLLTVRYCFSRTCTATSTPSRRCSSTRKAHGIGVIVLGDLVGYGAEPNLVIDKVRALDPLSVIRGNHDKAACGLDDGSQFNQVARLAAAWTGEHLTPFNRHYLHELPMGPVQIDASSKSATAPRSTRTTTSSTATTRCAALEGASRPLCFFGHTHLPAIFWVKNKAFEGAAPNGPETLLTIEDDMQYLVNPGSVGQPRDGDPRAAYALLDVEARELKLRRFSTRSRKRSGGSSPPDCLQAWPTGWRWGDSVGIRIAGCGMRNSQVPDPAYRIPHSGYFCLRLPPLFPSPQLRRERVLRGAAAEDPANHDADEQNGGDEDEVRRRHVGEVHERRDSDGRRRLTVCSSRSTVPRRRQIE